MHKIFVRFPTSSQNKNRVDTVNYFLKQLENTNQLFKGLNNGELSEAIVQSIEFNEADSESETSIISPEIREHYSDLVWGDVIIDAPEGWIDTVLFNSVLGGRIARLLNGEDIDDLKKFDLRYELNEIFYQSEEVARFEFFNLDNKLVDLNEIDITVLRKYLRLFVDLSDKQRISFAKKLYKCLSNSWVISFEVFIIK